MQRIERMKNWYNREYVVITTTKRRPVYLILSLSWVLLLCVAAAGIDFFGLSSIMVIPTKVMLDLFVLKGTFLEISLTLFLAIWLFSCIVVIIFGPFFYLAHISIETLDKEFVGDPERTEKWRTRRGKKKEE